MLFTQIATTQPTTQNKTKQFGWRGIIIGKKTTPPNQRTTTPPDHNVITFKADLWYAALL
jgi:hypothetical protein